MAVRAVRSARRVPWPRCGLSREMCTSLQAMEAKGLSLSTLSIDECVDRWRSRSPQPLSFRDLYDQGRCAKKHLEQGVLLRAELCKRLARSVWLLQALPDFLAGKPRIRKVVSQYVDSILDLQNCPVPQTPELNETFCELLRPSFQRHDEAVKQVFYSVWLARQEAPELYESQRQSIEASLKAFLLDRLALTFLVRQHLDTARPVLGRGRRRVAGHSGFLDKGLRVFDVAKQAAVESTRMCRDLLGAAPRIRLRGMQSLTLLHSREALRFILVELLKNSCRAVVEQHGERHDGLPDILINVEQAPDSDYLVVKILDEGGGLPPDAWGLTTSTFRRSAWADYGAGAESEMRGLSGFGIGLPRSQLYSRYFGGDLFFASTASRGTTATVLLEKDPLRREWLGNA